VVKIGEGLEEVSNPKTKAEHRNPASRTADFNIAVHINRAASWHLFVGWFDTVARRLCAKKHSKQLLCPHVLRAPCAPHRGDRGVGVRVAARVQGQDPVQHPPTDPVAKGAPIDFTAKAS
jgi:hypothetical protein